MCVDTKEKRIVDKFYEIVKQKDGTADVYLIPNGTVYVTEDGFREYDATVLLVRGVASWDGMEEDIRRRYDSWCASAEDISEE